MSLNSLMQNRNIQFTTLNVAGWTGYCVTSMIGPYYYDKPWSYVVVLLFGAGLGLLLSFIFRPIYRRFWGGPVFKLTLIVILVSYLFSLIWTVPYNYVYYTVYKGGWTPDAWTDYLLGGSKIFYVFLCWGCLYYGIKFYQAMMEASEKALKATTLAHEAQLKMLRYQLNPHFLFNTLNAISTLILEKANDRANEMVARLSNFLRYSLDNDPMLKTSLATEVMTLKLYLCIEKVRFEERLQTEFEIDDDAAKAMIPSLILQPLVENSIKYAIARSEEPGLISLRAKVFAGDLLMELRDNGPGIELDNGELPCGRGVGIRNTQQRLNELYGSRHSFRVSNVEPHGLQISIRLPFEVEDESTKQDE